MTPALPPEIETLLDVCVRTSMNYRTTGQSPERERYDAARAALESAITAALSRAEARAGAAERERDEAWNGWGALSVDADALHDAVVEAEMQSAALRSERDALAAALREAIELAAEGWGYASDYFRDKWGYEERIAALRAATPSEPRNDTGARHAE
jgi:hypothetical protein